MYEYAVNDLIEVTNEHDAELEPGVPYRVIGVDPDDPWLPYLGCPRSSCRGSRCTHPYDDIACQGHWLHLRDVLWRWPGPADAPLPGDP
jgi:hypothetical protein